MKHTSVQHNCFKMVGPSHHMRACTHEHARTHAQTNLTRCSFPFKCKTW